MLKLATATAALAVALPATAQAATVTVTGDNGQPRPISTTAPTTIRNMDVQALTTVTESEAGHFRTQVIGPGNVPVSTASPCWNTRYSNEARNYVTYRGNGAYRVVVQYFSADDDNCATPTQTLNYLYNVAAGVAIGQPQNWLLTRLPNEFGLNEHRFAFQQNPGATTYEVRYAREGTIGPDGAIQGPSGTGYVDRATGTVPLRFDKPGNWVIVARARTGSFYTPWSRAVSVRVKAPFDLERVTFPDARGPRYRLKGFIRDNGAGRKRVKIALARGRKGGKFRSLGRAKIKRNGTFALSFTARKTGRYRIRYSYPGARLMAKGSVIQGVIIRRRLL